MRWLLIKIKLKMNIYKRMAINSTTCKWQNYICWKKNLFKNVENLTLLFTGGVYQQVVPFCS